MAFSPRNVGTFNPHEDVVLPSAALSLVTPDQPEEHFGEQPVTAARSWSIESVDPLPGFDPAAPTDAERQEHGDEWPKVCVQRVLEADPFIAIVYLPEQYRFFKFDGKAWRSVDDEALFAAMERCQRLLDGTSLVGRYLGFDHLYSLLADDALVPTLLPVQNALLTLDITTSTVRAYPSQNAARSGLGHVHDVTIDWNDVDVMGIYAPVVSRDAPYETIHAIVRACMYRAEIHNNLIDRLRDAAHARYETQALLQALAETEAAPAIPAPRRARL
ncbi:hypothetical protein [Burkholderia gladioli]|uniref:hypothetical protein n=1 Tax=Burkholderia gladioli TaxID=28095 RepID=UPI0016415BE8|nr:hypothetical protein [Burkholderia gladioli]